MPKKHKSLLSYKKFKPATKGTFLQVLLSKLLVEGGIKLLKLIADWVKDS